jgi:diguanylate cyclase (GGDEF)-like protein
MHPSMEDRWSNPEADDSFLQFRARAVRDGIWLSLVTVLIVFVYILLSWDSGKRGLILVLLVSALAVTAGMSRLPAAAIVRSRWREQFFLVWTLADIALIAAIVSVDGGSRSVLGAIFFLPLIFGSLSYPASSVAICGALSVVAYAAGAELAGGSDAVAVGVFSALLVTATVMGASQASNRERQRRELARLSRSDPLTGCLNRRGFTERFEAELSDYVRHDGRPLGLIVIDLDNFKAVNDTRGHAAGDALLCSVADALSAGLRPSDVLARLGGDEFAVLLPEADPGALQAAAERLHERLGLVIAGSLGLASLPDDGETAEALHQSADADLYRSKQRRPVAAIA